MPRQVRVSDCKAYRTPGAAVEAGAALRPIYYTIPHPLNLRTPLQTMARKFFYFAPVFCLLLLATGCGQKGPLYLPGDPNEEQIEIPQQESDETAAEDEQESGEQSNE